MSKQTPQTTPTEPQPQTPQKNRPQFQRKSQRAEPDSIKQGKLTLLSEIQDKIQEVLSGYIGTTLKVDTIENPGADLEDGDLILSYDVKVFSNKGFEFGATGESMLASVSEPSAIAEAPQVFQGIFYSSVWQPLRVKLFRFLQSKASTKRVLPALIGGLNNAEPDIPRIPSPVDDSVRVPLGE